MPMPRITNDDEPGIFPYSPDIDPDPGVDPDYSPGQPDEPHDPDDEPHRTHKRVQGRQKGGADPIKEFGSTPIPEVKSNIHCISIVGQIEGHLVLPPQNKTTKYEHIIPQLVAIEQASEIEGLLVILNTVGGDVEAGLALAEMIASLSKPSVSIVLGGGHSIGVPIEPMSPPPTQSQLYQGFQEIKKIKK